MKLQIQSKFPTYPFQNGDQLSIGKSQNYNDMSSLSKMMVSKPAQSSMSSLLKTCMEFNPKREKKQMHFSSRQEMMRYITNFKIHYKTELCKNWVDFGYCEFGQECAYAHGYDELNQRARHIHKNYKTKMCK